MGKGNTSAALAGVLVLPRARNENNAPQQRKRCCVRRADFRASFSIVPSYVIFVKTHIEYF